MHPEEKIKLLPVWSCIDVHAQLQNKIHKSTNAWGHYIGLTRHDKIGEGERERLGSRMHQSLLISKGLPF